MVVSVALIGRMVERGTEHQSLPSRAAPRSARTPRFARDPGHFATTKPSGHKQNPEQSALDLEGGVA